MKTGVPEWLQHLGLHKKNINCRCRYELSLYANISNMVWSNAEEGQVAGTIVDKSAHDIRQFCYQEDSLTQFELVNKLWGLID